MLWFSPTWVGSAPLVHISDFLQPYLGLGFGKQKCTLEITVSSAGPELVSHVEVSLLSPLIPTVPALSWLG